MVTGTSGGSDDLDEDAVRTIVEETLKERSASSTRRDVLKAGGLLGAAGLAGAGSASATTSSATGTLSVGSVTANTYRIAADLYGGPAGARSELVSELDSDNAGAKYRAEDTGGWYHWTGSGWGLMDGQFKSLDTDEASINGVKSTPSHYDTHPDADRMGVTAGPKDGLKRIEYAPDIVGTRQFASGWQITDSQITKSDNSWVKLKRIPWANLETAPNKAPVLSSKIIMSSSAYGPVTQVRVGVDDNGPSGAFLQFNSAGTGTKRYYDEVYLNRVQDGTANRSARLQHADWSVWWRIDTSGGTGSGDLLPGSGVMLHWEVV